VSVPALQPPTITARVTIEIGMARMISVSIVALRVSIDLFPFLLHLKQEVSDSFERIRST
jgi:hypothetical protein